MEMFSKHIIAYIELPTKLYFLGIWVKVNLKTIAFWV